MSYNEFSHAIFIADGATAKFSIGQNCIGHHPVSTGLGLPCKYVEHIIMCILDFKGPCMGFVRQQCLINDSLSSPVYSISANVISTDTSSRVKGFWKADYCWDCNIEIARQQCLINGSLPSPVYSKRVIGWKDSEKHLSSLVNYYRMLWTPSLKIPLCAIQPYSQFTAYGIS